LKHTIDAQWLAGQVDSPRADRIAAGMSALITSGGLAPGAQLPTVRDLAQSMRISPSTVMNAWHKLRADGLIETHRRGGTVVRHPTTANAASDTPHAPWRDAEAATGPVHNAAPSPTTRRERHLPRHVGDWAATDFSRATADPLLQPDLGRALAAGLGVANLHNADREAIIDSLARAVAPTWPFSPEAWLTSGGGTEGLVLALQAVTRPGDVVAIENPSSPRLCSILATLELRAVAVDCDDEGPSPDALRAALGTEPILPKAFVYQPRAQVPTGRTVSAGRRDALAAILALLPDVYVIEDDHLGSVTHASLHSIATLLPSRCVLVRAYCRAFGVDLRTSVIGGSRMLIERIDAYRNNRLAMPSRILQGALAFLLTDADAVACLERARDSYEQRRQWLIAGLRARGIEVPDGTGLVVWLPVPDESRVIVNLATHGVIVAGGSACFVDARHQPHIRISISQLPDDPQIIDRFAQMVVSVISGPSPEEYD